MALLGGSPRGGICGETCWLVCRFSCGPEPWARGYVSWHLVVGMNFDARLQRLARRRVVAAAGTAGQVVHDAALQVAIGEVTVSP